MPHDEYNHGWRLLVGELLGHLLAARLLEHAAGRVRDLLVDGAELVGVLAELLLHSVNACDASAIESEGRE